MIIPFRISISSRTPLPPESFEAYAKSCNRIINKFQLLVGSAPQYASAFVSGVEKALDELLAEHRTADGERGRGPN